MSLEPFTYKSDAHLTEVPREPDESLHDYLVRANRTLTRRVRVLARARDEAEYLQASERTSWRMDRLLLTFAGPLMGAAAYVGLVRAGITEFARFEFVAGVVAVAGITGGPFVRACAAIGPKVSGWLLAHRSRRVLRSIGRRP
jgi:hypothetical protein